MTDDGRITGYLARHLVALCIAFRDGGKSADGAAKFAVYPGTLLEVRGVVFFVTAGHNLKEIDDGIAGGILTEHTAVLADVFGLEVASDKPIPFALKEEPRFYVDEDGLDVGVIPLRPHYVNLLARNRIEILTEIRWTGQDAVTFDRYILLGTPAERVVNDIDRSGIGLVEAVAVGVTPIQEVQPTTHQRFVGRLGKHSLSSVKGMSGGPVFGFSLNEKAELRYWIVAIQSSWVPGQQKIYACPLPVLAAILTQASDAWRDPADGDTTAATAATGAAFDMAARARRPAS